MMRTHRRLRNTIAMLGLLASVVMATSAMAAKSPPQAPVNINTASVEQLMEIPGIGVSKAQAIVSYRASSTFGSTAELVNVKGIGDKLLAKISPYVTTGGKATSSGTATRTRN